MRIVDDTSSKTQSNKAIDIDIVDREKAVMNMISGSSCRRRIA